MSGTGPHMALLAWNTLRQPEQQQPQVSHSSSRACYGGLEHPATASKRGVRQTSESMSERQAGSSHQAGHLLPQWRIDGGSMAAQTDARPCCMPAAAQLQVGRAVEGASKAAGWRLSPLHSSHCHSQPTRGIRFARRTTNAHCSSILDALCQGQPHCIAPRQHAA